MVQCRADRWTLSEYSPYASMTQMLQSLAGGLLSREGQLPDFAYFTRSYMALLPLTCIHMLFTIENSHPWLPSNSNHCRLLQILILSSLNAIEPAASTHIVLLPDFDSFKKAVCTVSHPIP